MLATLVAPIESDRLPGPVDQFAGHAEARAQTQDQSPLVVDGDPDDCEEGWTPREDLCRFEAPSCPSSPYNDIRSDDGSEDRLMQPSISFAETSYPEFCEERVTLADEPEAYYRCAGDPNDPDSQTMENFAVILHNPGTGQECWALQLRACEVGVQVSLDWCEATSRRSWTCDDGEIPRNEFNTCYKIQTVAAADQICAGNAPELKLMSCADYVGTDYTDAVMCAAYGSGSPWQMTSVANNPYWCKFDASLLNVDCHDASTPAEQCEDSPAMCLKRASGTGGCDGIARTMQCRNLQSDYRAHAETVLLDAEPQQSELLALAQDANLIRLEGCEPCQVLPFQPTPWHCPDDLIAEPVYDTLMRDEMSVWQRDMLDQQSNIVSFVLGILPCSSPPPGDPTWQSTHPSGAAVVNAPVIVHVQRVPVDYRPGLHSSFDPLGEALDWSLLVSTYALFPEVQGNPSETLVRTYHIAYAGSYGDATSLANQSFDCVVEGLPAFEVIVEELWPDKDYTAISQMFGADALSWWDALSDTHGNPDHEARRRRTQARGITYWPDLTDANARRARDESLETRVSCNTEQAQIPWCRWIPARSGYYRLKVAGAWLLHAREDRFWKSARQLRNLRTRVANLTPTQRARTFDTLAALGCGQGNTPDPACAWSPGVLGLNNTLTDILPTGPNDILTANIAHYQPERDPEHLYRLAGDHHRFGGMDMRVRYLEHTYFSTGGYYTETETFGIQVSEVRVGTVAATQ